MTSLQRQHTSEREHTVTLTLAETPTDILKAELARARDYARRCESQGSWMHTWTTRAEAIDAELRSR